MLCKRTVKNQVTLPKKIASQFQNVIYFNVETEQGKIVLTPVTIKPASDDSLSKIRRKIATLELSDDEIAKAISWARKK
jgi:hypothetical protein